PPPFTKHFEDSFLQSAFFCLYTLRASRNLFRKRFEVSAHGGSRFPNGLAFPRMAKVVFRMVWSFCAWRKLFSEWFDAFAVRGKICEKLGCVL
ncbi:hypothetical protein, partial [Segatella salivae]|uniref:hypothetical protein n=1 Tax=Segatella salivae TaxID=228604 RepID=UPI0028E5589D